MGNFYVNSSVKGPTQDEIANALRGIGVDAFVGLREVGWCCFSDQETSMQEPKAIEQLGMELSSLLGAPVLCILNHDDDVLSVDLFADGEQVAEYNSCPGYFDADPTPERLKPRLTGRDRLAALGIGTTVEDITAALVSIEGLDAIAVHERLAKLRHLPEYSLGFGYAYAIGGDLPNGSASFFRTTA